MGAVPGGKRVKQRAYLALQAPVLAQRRGAVALLVFHGKPKVKSKEK